MPSPALRDAVLRRQARVSSTESASEAYEHDEKEEARDDVAPLESKMRAPTWRAHESAPRRPSNAMVPPACAPHALSPLKADDCFSEALELTISVPSPEAPGETKTQEAQFRAYYTPPAGEMHRGQTVFVCHHGAGFGALSYALAARDMYALSEGEAGVLSYDARGHGRTQVPWPAARDMSREALADDLIAIILTLFPDAERRPAFVLVGHSMGGAVVVEAAHRLHRDHRDVRVTGVAMLDIVEGTSLRVLPNMSDMIRRRPSGFASEAAAVQWHLATRTLRNAESARRSVPALVHEVSGAGAHGLPWRWNADLLATEPFWTNWFTGLSDAFLRCPTARLLLLAEKDHLDETLMIGQMQGKFQLVVCADAGHCVHEVRRGAHPGLPRILRRDPGAFLAPERPPPTGPPPRGRVMSIHTSIVDVARGPRAAWRPQRATRAPTAAPRHRRSPCRPCLKTRCLGPPRLRPRRRRRWGFRAIQARRPRRRRPPPTWPLAPTRRRRTSGPSPRIQETPQTRHKWRRRPSRCRLPTRQTSLPPTTAKTTAPMTAPMTLATLRTATMRSWGGRLQRRLWPRPRRRPTYRAWR